ncbi:MAG TPA: MFS transporter [Gemmatimonadales bacterium]|nr:MFS transporter [Gemmatimonadales bacterium]
MGGRHSRAGDRRLSGARRWRILALLALAQVLGMSLWFSANAVSGHFRALWGLSAAETGWLTAAVQLGFVAGSAIAAVLNLADLVPARVYFAGAALLGAAANAALLAAPGFTGGLACRFFAGFFLAGVYPPAMKMAATWFRADRGLAIGTIVGALTVGKAIPYLVRSADVTSPRTVILTASLGAVLAAALVGTGYRDGPHEFPRRPFSWRLVTTVAGHRETRLATAGYLGHMWELYAMWTWVPAFIAASAAERAVQGHVVPVSAVYLLAFGAIAVGGVGALWGGWAARAYGYTRVVTWAMAASGLCSLGVGLAFGASFWLLGPLVLLWGFFVVADSAQFSALVTEVAPPHAVGTALTLQTSLGFLLTMVTIQLVPALVDLAGWRLAFPVLALGPAAGIAAIRRLGGRM